MPQKFKAMKRKDVKISDLVDQKGKHPKEIPMENIHKGEKACNACQKKLLNCFQTDGYGKPCQDCIDKGITCTYTAPTPTLAPSLGESGQNTVHETVKDSQPFAKGFAGVEPSTPFETSAKSSRASSDEKTEAHTKISPVHFAHEESKENQQSNTGPPTVDLSRIAPSPTLAQPKPLGSAINLPPAVVSPTPRRRLSPAYINGSAFATPDDSFNPHGSQRFRQDPYPVHLARASPQPGPSNKVPAAMRTSHGYDIPTVYQHQGFHMANYPTHNPLLEPVPGMVPSYNELVEASQSWTPEQRLERRQWLEFQARAVTEGELRVLTSLNTSFQRKSSVQPSRKRRRGDDDTM